MSLYGVQKLIFQLNRDPATRQRYAHAVVCGVERIANHRVRALLATGDAGRVTADACEYETHRRPSARE